MRVALFGAGSIGKRHLANLKALRHEAVLIDTDPTRGQYRRLSAQCGTLDAAIIATPAETHLGLLRDCIAWGVPVLVEKPVGTVADLPTLRGLRPTKPVMVGYQLRFQTQAQSLKQLAHPLVAGTFRIECDMRTWPGAASGGSALLECSHEIDLALWCGASDLRSATTGEHSAVLAFRNGRVVINGRASRYWREWDGTNGSLGYQWSFDSPEALGEQMYLDELAHFLRAVEGGPVAPGCTLEEGIAVLEVVRQVKEGHAN